MKITTKQQKIIEVILRKKFVSSSEIHKVLMSAGEEQSLVTVKRILSEMKKTGLLLSTGGGRATSYKVSVLGRVFSDVNAHAYCLIEPDRRHGMAEYNFGLLSELPLSILEPDELHIFEDVTAFYKKRTSNLSSTIQKKEMERIIIELSWKSSKIEGNTYTLLDTEKLILENKKAQGHSAAEAQMILNHKDAFNFIHQHSALFKTVTLKNLEELHSILVKNLSVGSGLRKRPVGIVGSLYKTLDNVYQIKEAVELLSNAVSRMMTPYEKALVALLGISYIQPFEDGNKRTSRLLANAILLAYNLAPLSYRSVDEDNYREAMLVFHELNSIVPFKKIFIEQYAFAAQNYAVM